MRIGVISGTATYALPGLADARGEEVETRWGAARVTRGELGGAEVLHISRHGEGHPRLSSHVEHRANIAALHELGAEAVVSVTVCGAVDPTLDLGTLVAFDDLHFVHNRLPDGSPCSFHTRPGEPGRGHWIFDAPFSEPLRAALRDAADTAGHPARDGGCYGHVDGPRFNSRAEIRGLAACGVTAVSQTAGPETVLCGELELPYALLGYVTDHANGVGSEPTPVEELLRLIQRSPAVFGAVLAEAVPRIAAAGAPSPVGTNYRFGDEV
jgi:5'-methylthioadenosine phosphorylase